ncbi:MAG TPA: hypothetical protein PK504_13680 [Ferruginibacter sp.]|nr:hypothetical protein [Ferruginibacter sp.]HRE64484.1 hypothetical protein [Ferruginibacter sp.]
MKYFLITALLSVTLFALQAQNLQLHNNVVYENNKPIAVFTKQLYNNSGEIGLTIANNNKILFTVVPKKFKAPVKELRSFYYHELIFNNGNDSLAFYSTESLILHVFNLIKEYNLIPGGIANAESFATLKKMYNRQSLESKIEVMMKYLNETRNFNYQAERDRSKPVYLINEKTIMQDSTLIGYIMITEQFQSTNSLLQATNQMVNPNEAITVQMVSNIEVQPEMFRDCLPNIGQMNKMMGNALYKISKPSKLTDANIYCKRLALACCLIENYAL